MRDFTLFQLTAVTLFLVVFELNGVIAPVRPTDTAPESIRQAPDYPRQKAPESNNYREDVSATSSEANDETVQGGGTKRHETINSGHAMPNEVKYDERYLKKMMDKAQKHAAECLMVCLSQPGYIAGIYDSDDDSCHCLMYKTNVINEIPLLESPTILLHRSVCTLLCKFQQNFYHRGEYRDRNKGPVCRCYSDDSKWSAAQRRFSYLSQENYLKIG